MKREWSDGMRDDEKIIFSSPLPGDDILCFAPASSAVLDAGCGYGRVLSHLYTMGYRNLTGIDVSETLIARARQECPTATYHVQDIRRIQLQQKFDLILAMGVIEYLLEDEEQRRFFQEIRQALNQNGHVVLETFVLDRENMLDYLVGFFRTGHWGRLINGRGFECHHQSTERIDRLVSEFFEVVRRIRRKFTTWTGDECNGYSLVLRAK